VTCRDSGQAPGARPLSDEATTPEGGLDLPEFRNLWPSTHTTANERIGDKKCAIQLKILESIIAEEIIPKQAGQHGRQVRDQPG
jgi:hypothetical protein